MTQEIQVNLASSVVSVTGAVNGVAVVFTLTGSTADSTIWTATADRATNNTYVISLVVVDSLGGITNYNTTLYYGITSLVTDRQAYDVEHWRQLRDKGHANMTAEEKTEWEAGNMKGAYNISDLNRVGGALNYIKDRLAAASYLAVDAFTAKGDWKAEDIPTAADLEAYLNYVAMVREAMAQFPTTPPTPTYSGGLDYNGANNIERIIIDVDTLITNMLAARYFMNELYCGEVEGAEQ